MKAIIIQPPLVQLNTPYPSGAYLTSFFKNQNVETKWFDFSFGLYSEIFSSHGLKKLFDLSSAHALELADKALTKGDEATAFNLRRYVSLSDVWIEWIDGITSILTGEGNRELCHKFVFSPHVPRGARMERFLENLERMPTTDDARFLACMALSDLADYITAAFDNEFSLIRYAEALTVSEASFKSIEEKLNAPVLENFYKSVLEKNLDEFKKIIGSENQKTFVCISVPFAGTFAAALYTGKFFKQNFGDKIFVSIGGGFVNTELRHMTDCEISKYIDSISYDRGYGSYKNILDILEKDNSITNEKLSENQIYKMKIFAGEKVSAECDEASENFKKYKSFENKITSQIVPDYSDIDFTKYPRMLDDINPMQRLWSDGSWLKAYLAHGCYWHQCAFCDVNLDYVCGYQLADVEKLYNGLKTQCEEKKVSGIHFVDEALPPVAMKKFAALNASEKNNLSWWGNVRFEKTYSRDMADFFSYGGLIGVSGGIEIATGSGLDSIHKGTDIDSIVSACCAFKEAGILIHAYMIYGYYGESEQDTINSMETLRQFYAAGLLDSCFWHKFVLTRYSRIYSEWEKGMHPELKVYEPANAGVFAKNGLHFEGEKKSAKFGDGLNAALQSWMHGEQLNKKVNKWFNFNVPSPTIPPDYIEKAIERYEARREKEWNSEIDVKKLWWLGGKILPFGNKKFLWHYMGEEYVLNAKSLSEKEAELFVEKIYKLKPGKERTNLSCESSGEKNISEEIKFSEKEMQLVKQLRGEGLVQV